MIYFLRFKLIYLIISLIFLGIGGYSILMYGLNYSIDFTGGSVLEYRLKKQISKNELTDILDENEIELVSFEQKDKAIVFRTSPIDEKQEVVIRNSLQELSKNENFTVVRFETVGPTLGKETIKKLLKKRLKYGKKIAISNILELASQCKIMIP